MVIHERVIAGSHHEGPSSITVKSMWDFWRTKWKLDRFLTDYLGFACHWNSTKAPQLHFTHFPPMITCIYVCIFIHSFISIQPSRPGWQEPEPSHVTGMALANYILGKFLGVVCHCFPPPLDVPTFAARCLYIRNDARDPSSERWKCGREIVR